MRWGIRQSYPTPLILCALTLASLTPPVFADEWPILVQEEFEQGAGRWAPVDPSVWSVVETDQGRVYRQRAIGTYKPPFRSPLNYALLKDVEVGSFELNAAVQTLQTSRGHRDMCLIFGYESPSRFYYVHLGEKTDGVSNQIHIVEDAPRRAITKQTNQGTPWRDDHWHHVRLVRDVRDGRIEIYFDHSPEPQLTAVDLTFTRGKIGIGSFDDFGQWDKVILRGERAASQP